MNEEIQYYTLGAKKDKKDKRDLRIAGIIASVDIPKQVFVLEETYGPNNQFSRGSCTAQAQAHHKERQENRESSARFIMALTKDYENNTNYGAFTRNPFKMVNKYGVCSESLFPELPPEISWEEYIDINKIPSACYEDAEDHKSASYWRIDKNIDLIRQTLIQYKDSMNSIVCSMSWYKEFNNPPNGVLPTEYSNSVGGHAVEIVGFDDFTERLKFKNSWGGSWGENGFFYMPYELFTKLVWDCWCSLDIPKELAVDSYYGQERTWVSFIRERAVAFNPWLINKIGRLPNNREIKGLAYGFHNYSTVFKGVNGDVWLSKTKMQLIKENFDYKV